MKQKRFLSMFALLLMAATGAWAQTTINVTAGDLGKAVCTDGSIYENVYKAQSAGKTAAAKIICLDTQNSKALALSLDNQAVTPSTVNYATAQSRCEALNTTLAVTFGTWVLPSKAQWEAMIEAAGGYKKLRDGIGTLFGGTKMEAVTYWSSTAGTTGHWGFNFNDGDWSDVTYNSSARACLVINLPQTYSVTLAEGTEDGDNWTISPTEAAEGAKVTATYSGEKKVKSVKAVKKGGAPAPAVGTDLATITADYEAKDGETLTGTLASNVKISIADGATVTLKDVNINGVDYFSYAWAGITCAGDATITLEGTNTVKGFYADYPGIQVPMDKTLTIQGTGSLNARSNGYAAGIGGGYKIACGNITISGGTVEATGGALAAGIGGGGNASCGNITINGGTVTATGGNYGAGIGGGRNNGACGTITITSGVTSVTATKGANAPYSIGAGDGGQDITVNIENGANVTQK